jgi:hypothetical protein
LVSLHTDFVVGFLFLKIKVAVLLKNTDNTLSLLSHPEKKKLMRNEPYSGGYV